MKIFIAASDLGQKNYKNLTRINDYLISLGHTLISDNTYWINNKSNKKSSKNKLKNNDVKHFNMIQKEIHEADICIFECSTQSLALGLLIESSLELKKPTITLYNDSNIPHILNGINNKKLILKKYNYREYRKVIEEALIKAQSKRETRFNFFLNPSLESYIESASKKKNISKSTFIRNLIVENMKKNRSK